MTGKGSAKFGRKVRLSGPEMDRVFSLGRKFVQRDLICWITGGASPAGETRLGISISRKTGAAVRRNRLKRLLRESFRRSRGRLAKGFDVAAYPRPACAWTGLRDAEHAWLAFCRKAGILGHAQ